MRISNYDNYTIFCVHNAVMNYVVPVQSNELHVASIVSMLNQSRDACIDFHYCLSDEFKFQRYHELADNKAEDKQFSDKWISKQG